MDGEEDEAVGDDASRLQISILLLFRFFRVLKKIALPCGCCCCFRVLKNSFAAFMLFLMWVLKKNSFVVFMLFFVWGFFERYLFLSLLTSPLLYYEERIKS